MSIQSHRFNIELKLFEFEPATALGSEKREYR